jgi:hypothetical protein
MVPKLARPTAVRAVQVAADAASDAAPDPRTTSTVGGGAHFEFKIGKALEIAAGVSDQTEGDETHGFGGGRQVVQDRSLVFG